jgi:hypothetical protein
MGGERAFVLADVLMQTTVLYADIFQKLKSPSMA